MTVDIEKLEALAKAAPEGPWFGPEYAPGTSHVFDVDLGTLLHYESISTEQDACLRYVAAANPAAVLELIQTIRDLQSSVQGLKTGYEAYERVNAGLRAECEALRNKASCVDDCGAIIRKLVHKLRKAAPDNALTALAMDYLKRKGLQVSPMRSGSEGVEPDLDTPEIASLRKDAERWRCVRNAIPMQSPYAVWREGSHVVLGKDADDLVDNFLSAKEASHD